MSRDKHCPACERRTSHAWVRFKPMSDGKRIWGYFCNECWTLSTFVTDEGGNVVDVCLLKPDVYAKIHYGVNIVERKV